LPDNPPIRARKHCSRPLLRVVLRNPQVVDEPVRRETAAAEMLTAAVPHVKCPFAKTDQANGSPLAGYSEVQPELPLALSGLAIVKDLLVHHWHKLYPQKSNLL